MFYGFQEASEKRKCHFCTLFVKQDLDAHAGCPQLLCPQHAGPRGPRGPHQRAAGSTRTCGARMGFKALVSTARPAAQSDTRSPQATRWPPRVPGRRLHEQVCRPPAGCAHRPRLWCSISVGGRSHPAFPFGLGRPRAGSPLAATPRSAPSRKRPLDRGRQAALYDTNGRAAGWTEAAALLTQQTRGGTRQGGRCGFLSSLS